MKRLYSHLTLSHLLAGMTAVLTVGFTLLVVSIIGNLAGEQIERDIGYDLKELAFQTTDKLDRGMFERYREIQLISKRAELADPGVDLGAKRALLDELQKTYPYYAWIGVTDDAGRVLVATRGLLEGADVSGRPWFANAMHGKSLTDVHQAQLLTKLLHNPTYEPMRFFDIAFPYVDSHGTTKGVLGVHLSWEWAKDIENSVLLSLKQQKKVEAIITDMSGNVLLGPENLRDAHLEQPSVLASQEGLSGYTIETWPDGRRYLVGYSKSAGHRYYPGFGWTILVRQNLDEAYAPLQTLKHSLLWGGLFAACLFSLIVFFVVRRLTLPLRAITRAAREVEAGHAENIDVMPGHFQEIEVLSGALSALLKKLAAKDRQQRELNATLELRVAERTRELAALVDALQLTEQRLRAVTENIPAVVSHIGRDEQLLFLNANAARLFGKTQKELIGASLRTAYSPEEYASLKPYLDRALHGDKVMFETRADLADQPHYYQVIYVPEHDASGTVNGVYAMAFDVTDRKHSELLKAQSEARLRTITDNLPILISYIDRTETYRFANATYQAWFGISPDNVVGKTALEVVGPLVYRQGKAALRRSFAGEVVRFEAEYQINGNLHMVEVVIIPDITEQGVQGVYAMTTDVTAARHHARQLEVLARQDTLTGLPNRRSFQERLADAALRAKRSATPLVVMMLDVDRFKKINDTLGHAAGDLVLTEFAARLQSCVRATDTVSRLAGDEFTIILEGVHHGAESRHVAEKIVQAMQRPFMIQGASMNVSTSIGIASAQGEAIDIDKLLADADHALYAAKAAGRNTYRYVGQGLDLE